MDNKTIFKKNQKSPFPVKKVLFTLSLGFAIGIIVSFISIPSYKSSKKKSKEKTQEFSEIRMGGYKFTNPLLDCDNFQSSNLKSQASLVNKLNEYVEDELKSGDVSHISIYFRSMNNGPWIGINENYLFTPASLLKVPIMIAVLKKAEADTSLLKRNLIYTTPYDTNCRQNIGDGERLKLGNEYTVEHLLEYMIINSSNDAVDILVDLIGNDYFINVMAELGVNLKGRDLSLDFISVKEYSSFFRILYNASYLNRDMSEKALALLSRTKFNDCLPAKLPKGIKISHKFGERGLENSNLKQLHDCGIVYLPNSPYLLCVMTKGNDFDKLTEVISDVSKIVFNSVSEE